MREINENESKSKFASMQNENNANMNGKVQKSRKRKRAIKPVRQVKKMRLEKELFLGEQETSKSQSILESEILPELRHGSKQKCNQKIEIISVDSTSEKNKNENIEIIVLDRTSEQKCNKKIEIINLDSTSELNNEYIETIILDSTSEQKRDKKIIEIISLDSTSEQNNNENIEIINLDSSLSFEFTDDSWPTDENPFSLSGSCFSGQNSSCDGSDSEDETPEYIKKLAPRAVFDDYELGEMLGAGGFGQVIAATRKKDNLPVAIKFVHKSSVNEFKKLNGKEIPAEAYFQWQTHHRNVIDIYEVIYVDEYFVYVMERPENCKDLFKIIDDRYRANSTLTEKEARKYFTQVLRANICCEENGILHRDVKPENILVDMSCDEAKLIDFGLSSEVQEQPFTWFRGTPSYMPPEYCRFKQYDGCQGTVWQMGILLVDMLSPVFRAFEDISDTITKPPHVPKHLSPEAKNLIHSLLNVNPVNRPQLKEILNHPWIAQPGS